MGIFNGAVLVCNKRIEAACNIDITYRNANKRRILELEAMGIEEAKTYNKFIKWLYSGGSFHNKYYDIFVNKYTNIFDTKADAFIRAKFICYKEYLILNAHLYDYKATRNELLAMIKCGEPVYLNPIQATYVNSWTFE